MKSYEHEELRQGLANHNVETEAKRLEEMAMVDDYRFSADGKEPSSEEDSCYISDDDGSQKKDIAWSFVDQYGKRAFAREPRPILSALGSIESQYARPAPSQIEDGMDQLADSQESEDDYNNGIWDSMVNIYEASGEGAEIVEESENEEPEIATRVRDLRDRGRQSSTDDGIEGLTGHSGNLEECLDQDDSELEIRHSLSVSQVIRDSEPARVGATTRKRAGTGGKEKKRFRFT